MEEVWKDIYFIDKGVVYDYRGLYQVSNKGRIKSLNYNNTGKGKIRRYSKNEKGYLQVQLYKNGKLKNIKVHKLVAIMFIPNPENKPEINHEDGDKENCCVSNLYWCTHSENMQHAYNTGLQKKRCGREHPCSKMIAQYDLQGNFIKEWDSINKATKQTNIKHICNCCKGKRKTAGGYIWKYKDIS